MFYTTHKSGKIGDGLLCILLYYMTIPLLKRGDCKEIPEINGGS